MACAQATSANQHGGACKSLTRDTGQGASSVRRGQNKNKKRVLFKEGVAARAEAKVARPRTMRYFLRKTFPGSTPPAYARPSMVACQSCTAQSRAPRMRKPRCHWQAALPLALRRAEFTNPISSYFVVLSPGNLHCMPIGTISTGDPGIETAVRAHRARRRQPASLAALRLSTTARRRAARWPDAPNRTGLRAHRHGPLCFARPRARSDLHGVRSGVESHGVRRGGHCHGRLHQRAGARLNGHGPEQHSHR